MISMMDKGTDLVAMEVDRPLEPVARALVMLSPASRDLVSSLVRQLAEREGINMESGRASVIGGPVDAIGLWTAKLRQEGYSPNTIRTYMSSLNAFLPAHPKPSRLDVQAWLAGRLETRSSAAVSTDYKALRNFFSFLFEEGLWSTDPTAKVKSIRVRYESRESPPIEDVEAVLQYQCHDHNDTPKFKLMTLILATTGLRISEAAGAKRARIYPSRCQMIVIGKGDKEGTVPVPAATMQAMMAYMEANPTDSPYLFPGDTSTGYWTISAYEKTLRRACRKLGVKKMIPHQLRHFFATFALQKGAKLEVVSKILRHASVGTTANIYRHVLTAEMDEASRQFAPRLRQPLQLEGRRILEDGDA